MALPETCQDCWEPVFSINRKKCHLCGASLCDDCFEVHPCLIQTGA